MRKRSVTGNFLTPLLTVIVALTDESQVLESTRGTKGNELALIKAFDRKEFMVAERIVVLQLAESVIFRRYEDGEKIVLQYREFFDAHQLDGPFNNIYRNFFTGLIALNLMRNNDNQEADWITVGKNVIQKMDDWTKECKWNFENKALLLRAEMSYSTGDFDKASEEYILSIRAAREHRFLHEEALACELFSVYLYERGMHQKSLNFLTHSIKCYEQWGAIAVARILKAGIESKYQYLKPHDVDLTHYSSVEGPSKKRQFS